MLVGQPTATCGSGATPGSPPWPQRRRRSGRTSSATSGTRTSTTASGRPAFRLVRDRRHRRRSSGLRSTTRTGTATHSMTTVPRPERRAGLRRRHDPMVVGSRRQPRPRLRRRPTRRPSRRPSTCSPTWASSRHAAVRSDRGDRRRPTRPRPTPRDHLARQRARRSRRLARHRHRHGDRRRRRRVGGVEVSTDNGATWRRATGRGSWTYTFTPTPPAR